ncbi:MAG: C10 family peptidase [Candidatus Delongbacteria bacterium]|jgi:hypothetical protein|nr:C10 family peptidase [Candidatus Delongbacteria bacterium]
MKKIILMIIMLTIILSAAIVPVDRAQKVSENYYQNYAPISAKGNTVQKILTKEYLGQPTWYVVKFTEGFVIVAADDNVRPILGYSFNGKIDEDIYNMQNPFISKFSNYDKQIVHVIREQGMVIKANQKEWSDVENNVFYHSSAKSSKGPLLETTWGQGYPWNDQCPMGTPVGPVVTAMHQIMRFHQGPDTGNGSNSYYDDNGDTTGSHAVDFGVQTYDWNLMQTLNGSTSTQEEVDELAKISYHLGVSVNMDYNTDGSNAFMTDALTAYQNNWKYVDAVRQYIGTVTDSSAQYLTISAMINQNKPMQFAGSSAASGSHSYVLDGYNIETDNGIYLYHFNWGWNGSYDGWYRLDDLTPDANDFTEDQEFIYNLDVDGSLDQMPEPRNLSGTVDSEGNIYLTWDEPIVVDPMGTLVDYEIYRDDKIIGYVEGISRAYTDAVRPEGDCEYVVKAEYTNPYGFSLSSNSWTGFVVADPQYPPPIDLIATSYEYNRQKIDLSWSKPSIEQPLSYDIYSNGSFLINVPITGLTEAYEDNSFYDGWNEYYVRANYSDNHNSIASDPDSAWIVANPEPTNLNGSWDDVYSEVDLNWDAPVNSKALTSYNVYREDVLLANTGSNIYSDEAPLSFDANYFVAAVYDNPFGESGPSNQVLVGPPATISAPASIYTDVWQGAYRIDDFSISNSGIGTLDYVLSFEYTDQMTQKFEVTEASTDFNTTLSPYEGNSTGAEWAISKETNNLDGTDYAYVYVSNSTTTATLTSQVFDGTDCEKVEFDHFSSVANESSYMVVEYSLNSGGTWEQLYVTDFVAGAWGAPDFQSITLPTTSTTMMVRFIAQLYRRSGDYVALDNVTVTGIEQVIEPWFSFQSSMSGSVYGGSSVDIECYYDARTIPDGEYSGEITINSNDSENPDVKVTVTINVHSYSPPPSVGISCSATDSLFTIHWDYYYYMASIFYVYSSDSPYEQFTKTDSIQMIPDHPWSWSTPIDSAKNFYYLTYAPFDTTKTKVIELPIKKDKVKNYKKMLNK